MGNYKIKVDIKLVECDEEVIDTPRKKNNGGFEFNISGEEAISIDRCEKALLRINYAAVRDALSEHLTEISKKNSKKKMEEKN